MAVSDDAPIQQAIAYGIRAPNPHNTQAWKIRLVSATQMVLYVDERRLLSVTDPPSRQIHIGCGCFIETLAVGMSAHEYAATVTYLPEGPYSLAQAGRKPVAEITLHKMDVGERDELAGFINQQQTNRKAYTGPLLSYEEADRIRREVDQDGVELLILNGEADMRPFLHIFLRAIEIEVRTPRTWEETRIWFRYNERQRRAKRDGLSIPQAGIDGFARFFAERYLRNGAPRPWFSARYIDSVLQAFRKGIFSARGLVFVTTATNTQLDWLVAGRAFARVHLTLAALGMSCQPNSQVLQEYPEMDSLRSEFNDMLGIPPPGKVQMAVRVGRAKPAYRAQRRDPRDLLMP
jgi:hypothetical protein